MFLGINSLNHDASVCLTDGNEIKFAAHAERYSRIKNDKELNSGIIDDVLRYGEPHAVIWYEKPISKALRRLYTGETPVYQSPRFHMAKHGFDLPLVTVPHHAAHAAMGFYTSKFEDAAVVVVDAIGEWDTTTIWHAGPTGLKRVYESKYPDSMGLFYSAATDAIGLRPNEEEYILMGMAALGKPVYADLLRKTLFSDWNPPYLDMKYNLHKGMKHIINTEHMDHADFAASVQAIFEEYLYGVCSFARDTIKSKNLILVGGCALNCVANGLIADTDWFKNIWVPPNPGDAGLSLGAIAYHIKRKISFEHAYLGYDIKQHVDVSSVVDYLKHGLVIGIANGRAEFGPRALGNRSILADPRGPDVKDRVNEFKHREQFRPFAPAILEEHASKYFDIKSNHDYMQFAVRCKRPDLFPAIVHVDGTSRVQTVPKNSPSILRPILESWYARSGCPMLLNTSMNIKGQPLVNDEREASLFSSSTGIPTF